MLETIIDLMQYDYMQRAVIIGSLVSLCAALLGVSLVLKRYSMIGDGLSHVGFGALAFAMVMGVSPLYISIPVVVITAFLLLRISENSKIKGDAAIAMISSSALAFGIILSNKSSGFNTDLCGYMFGSILAISKSDVLLSIIMSVVVLVLYIVFYNKIFAVTFDESFSQAAGIKTKPYNMLIAILTAVTIVVGMRLMGAMLISSLIIFPALTSMRLFRSFRKVIISSASLAVVCFAAGLGLSYQAELPVGASIVAVNLAAFLLFSLISFVKRGVTKK